MKFHTSYLCNLYFTLQFAIAQVTSSEIESSFLTRPPSHRIDVSHLYHCNSTGIFDIVNKQISDKQTQSSGMQDELVFDIDASSSKLGDDGSVRILTLIMNTTKANPKFSIRTFGLRMNGITHNGASKILKHLISPESFNNQTYDENITHVADFTSIQTLDLGFNNIGRGRGFIKALQDLCEVVEDPSGKSNNSCPMSIRLDRCGLGPMACRAISKGLSLREMESGIGRLRELYLSGNPDIGDVGVAAIAQALKDTKPMNVTIFKVLDMSSCQIGDAGAESLSNILDDFPRVEHIDLSNNHITDIGAMSLGRALSSSALDNEKSLLKSLDLSGNKDIGDIGLRELAKTLQSKSLSNLRVRSCSIRADGTCALGEAIKELIDSFEGSNFGQTTFHVDLSGNQLGLAKGKTKKSGFSAKAATESATIAFNFIGKRIKSGLKDYAGIDVTDIMGVSENASAESDDEVEASMAGDVAESNLQSTRCGIRSLVDSIIGKDATFDKSFEEKTIPVFCFSLGMRQCALDQNAVDALAALVIYSWRHFGVLFSIDLSMNGEVDPSVVQDFSNFDGVPSEELIACAVRYFNVLQVLRDARDRSLQATSRSSLHGFENDNFDTPWGLGDESYDPDEYIDDYYEDFEDNSYDDYDEF